MNPPGWEINGSGALQYFTAPVLLLAAAFVIANWRVIRSVLHEQDHERRRRMLKTTTASK